jgi:hypothetical protein
MSLTPNLSLANLDDSDVAFGDFYANFKAEYNANMAALDSIGAGLAPFTTKGALATLTVANLAVECTGTVGFTMYLPASCPSGKTFQIWNNNTAVVTLSGNGANVNGAAALALTASSAVTVLKGTSAFVAY